MTKLEEIYQQKVVGSPSCWSMQLQILTITETLIYLYNVVCYVINRLKIHTSVFVIKCNITVYFSGDAFIYN